MAAKDDAEPAGRAERDLHARLSAVLAAARHVPEGERDTFLDRECAGDTVLRERVARLLRHAGRDVLDTAHVREGVAAAMAAADDEDLVDLPEVIGRYRVVGRLGRGGMGIVFEAEQDVPRRRVALKILRPGPRSRSVVRRFEREAEVLGKLHHPGIAQVFEAGVARRPDGGAIAFIAMELVRGEPITHHAMERGLDTTRRLELLAATCDAVQHAHARGFIHRDLKPSNILVDAHGQPKMLDFGIARASGADVEALTLHTAAGEIIGTLPYMSPEQAGGDAATLDTRSDVYALGVLAFELLVERLPLTLDALSISEAIRVVRDVEPARLGAIDRTLRGDVETIVAKALHKSPESRYQSAAEMAEDIRRHLRRDPIVARPPGTAEQLARLARRHRTVVVAAGIACAALLAHGVMMDQARRREAAQRRAADASAAAAVEAMRVAQRNGYLASLAAGLDALERADVASARRHLESAPVELRGWEWRHAWSRLDDSLGSLDDPLPEQQELAWPEPGRIVALGGDLSRRRLRAWDADGGDVLANLVVPAGDAPVMAASWRPLAAGALILQPGEVELALAFDDGAAPRPVTLPPCDEALDIKPFGGQRDLALLRGKRHEGWIDFAAGRGTVRPGPYHWNAAIDGTGRRVAWDIADTGLAAIADLATLAPIATLRGHSQAVYGVAWLPGDRDVITCSVDGTLRRWDAASGRTLAVMDMGEPATALAVGHGVVAVGMRSGLVRLVDPHDGATVADLRGASSRITAIALDPTGERMVSSEADERLRTWPVVRRDPRFLARHASFAYDVQPIPGSHVVVTASWDGTIRFVDARDGELLATRRCDDPTSAHREWSGLVAARDGRWVAAGGACRGPRVLVMDATTTATLADLAGGGESIATAGDYLVSSDDEGMLTSWRTSDWSVSATRRLDHPSSPTRPAIAGHPRLPLVAVDTPAGLALLDAASLQVVRSRATDASGAALRARSLTWTKDGRLLAVGTSAGALLVLDGSTLEPSGAHAPLQAGGYDVAVSPDETRLAAALDDGTVHLFAWPTLEEVAVLRLHANYVHALAWLADGSGLVTASGDGTVRSWTTWPLREQVAWQRHLPARRRELEPRVLTLREQGDSWEECAEALREDASLTPEDRELALADVMVHAAATRP